MSPAPTFRTRRARAVALDPLAALRAFGEEHPVRRHRSNVATHTACPDCSARVIALHDRTGRRLLVDAPDASRPARERATVTVGDDGRALELGDGQYPPDDRPAFVLHRLTCRLVLEARKDAAIERMSERAEALA